MFLIIVYCVYVYGINVCLSIELNLGVVKIIYIIYFKVFKKKMFGLKCNCVNVLVFLFVFENICYIFFVLKYVYCFIIFNKSSINFFLNLEILFFI